MLKRYAAPGEQGARVGQPVARRGSGRKRARSGERAAAPRSWQEPPARTISTHLLASHAENFARDRRAPSSSDVARLDWVATSCAASISLISTNKRRGQSCAHGQRRSVAKPRRRSQRGGEAGVGQLLRAFTTGGGALGRNGGRRAASPTPTSVRASPVDETGPAASDGDAAAKLRQKASSREFSHARYFLESHSRKTRPSASNSWNAKRSFGSLPSEEYREPCAGECGPLYGRVRGRSARGHSSDSDSESGLWMEEEWENWESRKLLRAEVLSELLARVTKINYGAASRCPRFTLRIRRKTRGAIKWPARSTQRPKGIGRSHAVTPTQCGPRETT